MQYKIGTVTTNGTTVITGSGTAWLGNVTAGSVFSIAGSGVPYIVGNVDSNTQITLTTPYVGPNASGQSYAITTSFTPNQGMPYPEFGDIDTPTILKRAFLILDAILTLSIGGTAVASRMVYTDTNGKLATSAHLRYAQGQGINMGWAGAVSPSHFVIGRGSVSGGNGTTFLSTDALPVVSGDGYIAYSGLVVAPDNWGNSPSTVDDHRGVYIAGSQRNAGARAATLAFANWGYFTNTGTGAGGTQNSTARGDAIPFKFELCDNAGQFVHNLFLRYRSASGVEGTVMQVEQAGGNISFNKFTRHLAGADAIAIDIWGRSADNLGQLRWLASNGATQKGAIMGGADTIQFLTGPSLHQQLVISHVLNAVNYLNFYGGATGANVDLKAEGSDADVQLSLSSKGNDSLGLYTGAFARAVAQFVNQTSSVNLHELAPAATGQNPYHAAVGNDTNVGFRHIAKGTGSHFLESGGGAYIQFAARGDTAATQYWAAFGKVSGDSPEFRCAGTDSNLNGIMTSKGTGSIKIMVGEAARLVLDLGNVSSSVNNMAFQPNTTGNDPVLITQGTDSNRGLILRLKGNTIDATQFQIQNGSNNVIARFDQATGTLANNFLFRSQTTGNPPTIIVEGSDADIDLRLEPKGTNGRVRFGTHTATALTISGYIEVRDYGGTLRKLAVVT